VIVEVEIRVRVKEDGGEVIADIAVHQERQRLAHTMGDLADHSRDLIDQLGVRVTSATGEAVFG
jgi:hypothetical protein